MKIIEFTLQLIKLPLTNSERAGVKISAIPAARLHAPTPMFLGLFFFHKLILEVYKILDRILKFT